MWLLDLRSLRSDAPCRGGDRQGALKRKQRIVVRMFSLGVNTGFTQLLDILVLICFVATCRYDLLVRAR